MDENPNVLDFVKAVSDADRLRIIGVLAQHPATIREVAGQLEMPFRTAFAHLGMLEFAGVVHKAGDIFSLDSDALERLSREQFSDPHRTYDPLPDPDAKTRRVLETFLKPDIAFRQLPAQAWKLQVILKHVVTAFEPGTDYTEKQVNTILRGFHLDTATLRRALVDAGLLKREGDGSRYWREAAEN